MLRVDGTSEGAGDLAGGCPSVPHWVKSGVGVGAKTAGQKGQGRGGSLLI